MVKKTLFILIIFTSLIPSLTIAKPQNNVKAIVFDFGGVIVTTDKAKTIKFLTDSFQVSKKELKQILLEWKQILSNEGNEKEFWINYAKSTGVSLPPGWHSKFEKVTSFTDIPGMIPLVKNLQTLGYQTPMLSNIQKYQANVVRRFEYYSFFDPVLLSYEIGVEKPDKEAFNILLNQLQLTPTEIIFIDDQRENIQAAKEIGIDAIHFTSPRQLCEELNKRNINIPNRDT